MNQRSTLIQNVFDAQQQHVDYAKGVWLFDTDGKQYIDGSSGAVVVNIGHSHPKIVETMARQASRVSFTHRGAFTSSETEQLADALSEMTGFAGVWFVNSGSEAVEAAIQFALQYFRETGQPERSWFLSHRFGYHGNTLGALSLSGHGRRSVIGDLALGFPVLPTPYSEDDDLELDDESRTAQLLNGTRAQFEKHSEKLAAIVVEPVGGATLGATVPPEGYLAGLRALCDEFGVLMIVDEVMTGLGRTGTMLAVDRWNVRPDIVALGKGMGAGYAPIAAALVNDRVLSAIELGSRRVLGGHTYAGNPMATATTLAVVNVLKDENVIENSVAASSVLREGLQRLQEKYRIVADARGVGMLQALEFSSVPTDPSGLALARQVVNAAMAEGLVLYATTGGYNESVLVAPPLTISVAETEMLLAALDAALDVVESSIYGA